jgi:hypothetical protein
MTGGFSVNQRPGLRCINGIVSAILVCFFLAHAALGSASLLCQIPRTFEFLIWVGVGGIAIHILLCTVTSKQMLDDKTRPPSAKKKKHLVLKWLSGTLLVLAAVLHIAGFGTSPASGYHNFFLVVLLFITALLASHIYIGTKSLLKDLNMDRRYKIPVRLAVCVLALAVAVAIFSCF